MEEQRCPKCGGYLGGVSSEERYNKVFKDIRHCLDCRKIYLVTEGKLKHLTKPKYIQYTREKMEEFVF